MDYVRKIRRQPLRSGRIERVPQSRHGVPRRVDEALAAKMGQQVAEQPDRTLEQMRSWVWEQSKVSLSRPLVWLTLKRLGLRRKKSRSTRPNATPEGTVGGAKSSSPASRRSTRRDRPEETCLSGRKRRHHEHDAALRQSAARHPHPRSHPRRPLADPHRAGRAGDRRHAGDDDRARGDRCGDIPRLPGPRPLPEA